MRHGRTIVVAVVVLATLLFVAAPAFAASLTPVEQLGKELFFDTNLSDPVGQSCAACHAPQVGWTGPDASINNAGGVYEGAVAGRFGNRKPPAAAYAGDSPILHFDGEKWIGGMFWDGRATGERLGDPLAEQALGPFLNPLEQNMASPSAVQDAVRASAYASLFKDVWGATILDPLNVDAFYEDVGRSIAAYERSSEVSAFTSKYDAWLAGKAKLSGQEMSGYRLFMTKAKCGNCHVPPLFTDFTYDNLGIPRNLMNPFYSEPDWNPEGYFWVDEGLGGFLKYSGYDEPVWSAELGKFKVPTLRNVDLRPDSGFIKGYGHNAYFKSLKSIVHFYNTRDVLAWPEPEYGVNVNTTEMGNLRLTAIQENAIVAFMKTLSDGYMPLPAH